ncbi:hypothetical protein CC1G_13054 [Coprinopsis cinerea okayama7|uniref:Uncharacterized protein n=1 Tax=Coprinopsis cinerea (strain Okayama-7 / 130 / ATCC MYA-4618 / FGSC 9003) TaxID=240176 RepID=A8PB14_COPC7|nr:hypothetical protein CC1G_13054 [Coprinopsis cinerea okayama7\|eukprot:XP_001840089.2 hypothetical protein CC1G_13054 [Coprinopsis cinerea okayama7\
MSSSRRVFVDDTDRRIVYSAGPWVKAGSGALEAGPGGYGSLENTWHEVRESGSASYLFNGTDVWVMGATPEPTEGGTGVLNLHLACHVDGTPIEIFNLTRNDLPENYGRICWANDLDPREHQLTVTTTLVREPADTFLAFDGIFYTPIDEGEGNDENQVKEYKADDSAITYDGVWDLLRESSANNVSMRSTSANGATLTLDFSGTKASFVGWRAFGEFGEANASFVLDDDEPRTFAVPTLEAYHHRYPPFTFFETRSLSPGNHTLKVHYDGEGNNPAPLIFDLFLVRGGSPPPVPVDEGDSPSGDRSTSPPDARPTGDIDNGGDDSTARGTKRDVGAIVGGVLGAVAGLSLLVLIAILVLRARSRIRKESQPGPSANVQEPYSVRGDAGVESPPIVLQGKKDFLIPRMLP